MSSTAVVDALALVRAGVDGLLASELDGLSGLQVAGLIEALEVQRRRLDAVDARCWPRRTHGRWRGSSGVPRLRTC